MHKVVSIARRLSSLTCSSGQIFSPELSPGPENDIRVRHFPFTSIIIVSKLSEPCHSGSDSLPQVGEEGADRLAGDEPGVNQPTQDLS